MSRMQDIAALQARLAQLAAPGDTTELHPFGRRTLLSGLLAAIDATLLAETLHVESDDGRALLLDTGARRLRRIRPAGPDAFTPLDLHAGDRDPQDTELLSRLRGPSHVAETERIEL